MDGINQQTLTHLIEKYLAGSCTPDERGIVEEWYESFDGNKALFLDGDVVAIEGSAAEGLRSILVRSNTKRNIHIMRRWRMVAAAIVVLAIGLGVYYFSTQSYKSKKSSQIIVQTKADVAPGTNRAILTINNHQNINLASNKTGININNTITYNDGEKIADAGQLLQLSTPRGGQYQAVLPDGSKVWLNAESSIKFPSKFSEKERRVEVTGEVYMEVAKNLKVPFNVSAGKAIVQVLGTSFNINAYPDEENQRTTLVSGAVRVVSNNQEAILKPGQQSIIVNHINLVNQRSITVQTANVEQDIAWKNGAFNFNQISIQEIMRQLARWYDITVVYEVVPSVELWGTVGRDLSLQQVLKGLQAAGLNYRLEGRRLTILP